VAAKEDAEIETREIIHPTHEPSISARKLCATSREKVKLAEIETHEIDAGRPLAIDFGR